MYNEYSHRNWEVRGSVTHGGLRTQTTILETLCLFNSLLPNLNLELPSTTLTSLGHTQEPPIFYFT